MEADHPNLNRVAHGWGVPEFQLTWLFLYHGQTSSFWGSSASIIRKFCFCSWVPPTDRNFFCSSVYSSFLAKHQDWSLPSYTGIYFISFHAPQENWFDVPFISNSSPWTNSVLDVHPSGHSCSEPWNPHRAYVHWKFTQRFLTCSVLWTASLSRTCDGWGDKQVSVLLQLQFTCTVDDLHLPYWKLRIGKDSVDIT